MLLNEYKNLHNGKNENDIANIIYYFIKIVEKRTKNGAKYPAGAMGKEKLSENNEKYN